MEEPKRRSVLDILESNLKLANRNTFIHRFLYIAEHFDKNDDCREIIDVFVSVIKKVNEDYCDEHLTGLLLIYRNYFIHVLDGSEETLMKHFLLLFEEAVHLIGRAKMLLTCHHINQRFFQVWDYRFTKPPILLEAINPNCGFEEIRRYVEMCCLKITKLALSLQEKSTEDTPLPQIGEITPSVTEFLPENSLINFLLDTKILRDLRFFVNFYNKIPLCRFYTECIWPVRGDFVPYDIFDDENNPADLLDFQ